MTDRIFPALAAAFCSFILCCSGCASSGQSAFSVWRPSLGGWNGGQSGQGRSRSWNGPTILPEQGLEPTPYLQSPPSIQPGPALPAPSARRYFPFPSSAGTRQPLQRWQPSIPKAPQSGAPLAQHQDPVTSKPAELSGQIEIIPGPSLRARRAKLDLVPRPGAVNELEDVDRDSVSTEPLFEELPPPPEN